MSKHLMYPPMQLIPGAIAELFVQVSTSGIVTQADRYGLMAAVLTDNLSDEERCAVDRLLRAAYRGTLHSSDELSSIQ
jgi:hypothetical protein